MTVKKTSKKKKVVEAEPVTTSTGVVEAPDFRECIVATGVAVVCYCAHSISNHTGSGSEGSCEARGCECKGYREYVPQPAPEPVEYEEFIVGNNTVRQVKGQSKIK